MKKLVLFPILALALSVLIAARAFAAGTDQNEKRALFRQGARLWPVYCAQCHNARPGSEFSPQQWDAIMMHMRTLGNIPAQDSRALLEYLKGSR
ncbi:MAG TPA: hypothetical protein VFB33_09385 [Candidatus Binataceae bacterium]|jgi:mono/diheme cytochrome c family protein|nr:hypothetical protein [Candidatus Binataceae bacterium]